MMFKKIYPFSAIVGQEELKLALLLNAVNPKIGGVLIRGEKGTAKSTAVRALAALLPEMRMVAGCPFGCDPDDDLRMCARCRETGSRRTIRTQRVQVVTLPLNATEDRVVGGIDFNLAVKKGVRAVLPGLLAEANRSILYVDEVNLLDDHIVDIILDAAASGENRIEREGISFKHPASFILVGTMNPEEGELRPQLMDRFGLCVDVKGEAKPDQRVLLMERREAFDLAPHEFLKQFERENERIAAQVITAREQLNAVRLPKHLRTFISELCMENLVAGHRADLVMEQAARAHAVLRQRSEVTTDDITKLAPFVLVHRARNAQPPPPPPPESDRKEEPPETNDANEPDKEPLPDNPPEGRETQQKSGERISGDRQPEPDETNTGDRLDEKKPPEQIFDIGATFTVKKITSPRDRVLRRGSGRRSRTRIALKQGRYIKSAFQDKTGDIALDATLRAAAHHQLKRKNNYGLAVCLKPEDIRGKIREKRIGNFILFLVDASGSMGARGRMAASKGAIMSLLLDAYQKRDKVAMISFRKNGADINLPPTTSVEMAGKLLAEMPVGGRTPLSAGLAKAHEQVRNYLLRDPGARPIAIIITDGKTNVASGDQKPLEEAFDFAAKMAADPRTQYIVVDTEEPGLVSFGLAARLAGILGADYFKIENLKADQLVNVIKERR